MTVKTIVSRKGRDVVTIEPSATLEAAIATLAEHRIGAVVVLGADRRVIGILSSATSCAHLRNSARMR
jgi:CBS-domain-containing membrane protein